MMKQNEEPKNEMSSTGNAKEESSCSVIKSGSSFGALPIVPVRFLANGKEISTYAMLDGCSTGTFLREDIREKLGEIGTETNLVVKTINGSEHHSSTVLTNLCVTDLNGENMIKLPRTFTKDAIPAGYEDIPQPDLIKKYSYLKRVASKIPKPVPGLDVGLLIGSNCPKAIEPKDFVSSERGGPYAIKTFAGWTVVGPLQIKKDKSHLTCSRISVKEVNVNFVADHHFAFETSVKEVITPAALNKVMELEFSERHNATEFGHSLEDKRFLAMMNNECTKVDGHYQVPLPLRNQDVKVPNNREQVLQRMKWLKRKLAKNKRYYEDYSAFMEDNIKKGYVCKVPENRKVQEGKVWYIPHHGVYNANKPEKILIVYDCTAKFHGTSLNDQLIQGPDLTSTLIGVLVRFRQKRIAFTADIESMFSQVRVPARQRDLLRFLWWPGGDVTKEPEDYQMNVHLFGAVSSPSCANFCLNKAADDSVDQIGIETADVLKKNFYVDDCLRSEDTDEEAIKRLKGVQLACARGGFHLTKFASNSRKVLNSVPEQDRSKNVRTVNLAVDLLPFERALGVHWSVESDTFGFRIILNDKPPTRRTILSTVSSLYDRLGMAAPFLQVGKRILQDLCKINIDWDEVIPEEYKVRWERWRLDLTLLADFKMTRCYEPESFGLVVCRQLHHFSDASTVGYGQVFFMRMVNDKGEVHCSFLMGKARVSPTKVMTVPRLELVAAVTSVKIGSLLKRELDDSIDKEFYWTDSTTVLRYILNESARFHIFVANRVQMIRDNTETQQWHHIEGHVNPADDASRGLRSNHLLNNPRWIRGPEFLWQPEIEWPQSPFERSIPRDDPELRKVVCSTAVLENNNDVLKRLNRFSSWYKLKAAIAWILRIENKTKLHRRLDKDRSSELRPLTVQELTKAETVVIKLLQLSYFPKEISQLLKAKDEAKGRQMSNRAKRQLKKMSAIYRLDPFIDQDGLLRVGGRLERMQEFPVDMRHPVILPYKNHITTLIIRDAHERMAHAGRGMTLNEIRSRYWTINSNSAVRRYISKCVKCRRLRAGVENQKMANLPKERLSESPPFIYCGVDYFGPCMIKEGRKELKRYGVLFTCLVSQAIHLESAISLDTSSFLNALRRFIARRGPVREIRSDRGTNLVAAEKELKSALDEMDLDRINAYLKRSAEADLTIIWKRNPPAASHMGGVWEQQICSVRAVLSALMREHGRILNDESFRTLLTEVECVVNSRPLTFPSSDPDDLQPLTPNHILTMKSRVVMPPPGCFQRADLYLRSVGEECSI